MRTLGVLAAALALAGVVLTGCSSNSNGPSSGDSGFPDGTSHKPDGKAPPPPKDGGHGKDTGTGMDGSKPGMDGSKPGMDGTTPDGPCNFATFVKGLIANDTTATALPSVNIGQSCTDDMNQADYPPSFFQ